MAIPKIIHYIWVGPKPLPALAKKCIHSWGKYMPDCEIKVWNESNFDINSNRYCREAYAAKKYAFVSDYIRVAILYQYGGIYMDTDVELLQPLAEEFFECESFSGYETPDSIPTGIMGAIPGQAMFEQILRFYDSAVFLREDGTYNQITNVQTITEIAKANGFVLDGSKQTILGFTLYPQTYFCPLSHDTDDTCFSENTYTIHHFSGSWCDLKTRFVGRWNHGWKKKCVKICGVSLSAFVYRGIYNFCRITDFFTKK